MPEWIVKHWAQWLFGIAGTGIVAGFTALARYVKKRMGRVDVLEKRLSGMEIALRASMYDRLYYLHGKYMKQGWVSIPDFENIAGIYEGYHGLGGNGVGTKLYEDLDALPSFPPTGEKEAT